MPTSFPMSIPHAPTGFVNQAALDTAFSVPINDLYALLSPLLGGRIQFTQTTGIGQTLTNGSFTTITGYGIDIDTFGGSTLNATTGIWTCPAAGQYEIGGQCTTTSGGTRLLAAIQKNAVAIMAAYDTGTTVTDATAALVPKEFTLAAGDTINMTALVNAAGLVTASTNGSTSFVRIKRVG